MSLEFMLLILSAKSPSTTYKGFLPLSAVPKPLIITEGVDPGKSEAITVTPAALP